MNDRPLFNLVDYTPTEHALFALGCLCWVAAYVVLCVRIRRLKFVEMPVFAACGNMAWEAVWSLLLVTDMGRFFEWCYFAWFFLDLFIFGHIVWYGHKQLDTPTLARHFKPLALAGTLFMGVLYYTFVRQGLDTGMGARTGYLAQLPISLLYFGLLYDGRRRELLSAPIAWLRTIGTGLVCAFMFLRYPTDLFLLTLAAGSSLLDGFFVFQLHALGRTQASPAAAPEHLAQAE
jgi:hypothetical protein